MKVVIMAGRRGTRIAELFPDIPKPLIPLQQSYHIYRLNSIMDYGISKSVISPIQKVISLTLLTFLRLMHSIKTRVLTK